MKIDASSINFSSIQISAYMENESIKKKYDDVKLMSYLLKCLDLFELVLIVQGNIYLPWVQMKLLFDFMI